MTVGFALELIPRRMKELGHCDNYLIKWRHLQLDADEVRELDGHASLHYLILPKEDVAVVSNMGCFDLSDAGINEFQYEHRGAIKVTNKAAKSTFVLFIQAIAKHCPLTRQKTEPICQESHSTTRTCGCSEKEKTETGTQ
jgi:hypothetical protein